MKYRYLLNDIANESKFLAEEVALIPAKSLQTDKGILASLTRLAFILFINNHRQQAFFITEKLSAIPFENDYERWTWVEYAISLGALLSVDQGNSGRAGELIAIIHQALNSGEGLQKTVRQNVHNRFMAGAGVELNLSSAVNAGDELNARLHYLMALVKIRALGGSQAYPASKADENIDLNINAINILLDHNAADKRKLF